MSVTVLWHTDWPECWRVEPPRVYWSAVSDPMNWAAEPLRREGTKYVAGPFATDEEARQALKLLVTPPAGTA